MALERYLREEVAIDHADGYLSRREALRRLAYLGLAAPAAAALLAACARDDDSATPSRTPGESPAGPEPAPTEDITFSGPGDRDTFGTFAEASDPKGAVLVIHENRGLTDHIKSVAGRFATSGYSALAVDLLSAGGGTKEFDDEAEIMQQLSEAQPDDLVADMTAAIDELERRVPDAKIGAIGFCFGGGMVWQLVQSGEERLAAASPFYGTTPEEGPDFADSNAAVLGVYAELDDRVNATRDGAEAALQDAGLEHEIVTYPGVDHAFFNATGDNYDKAQAEKAYAKVTSWFDEYLA
ncbi:dienelactone hydrolase family protein [Aeromicrobium sp.]|uniref:dienelactone hydrolase family protein n=1 Tax=Aeromicrobium sp. TaxID=1871063 RepID=UPI003D6C14F8